MKEALAVKLASESCLLDASEPQRLPILLRNKAITVLLEIRSGHSSQSYRLAASVFKHAIVEIYDHVRALQAELTEHQLNYDLILKEDREDEFVRVRRFHLFFRIEIGSESCLVKRLLNQKWLLPAWHNRSLRISWVQKPGWLVLSLGIAVLKSHEGPLFDHTLRQRSRLAPTLLEHAVFFPQISIFRLHLLLFTLQSADDVLAAGKTTLQLRYAVMLLFVGRENFAFANGTNQHDKLALLLKMLDKFLLAVEITNSPTTRRTLKIEPSTCLTVALAVFELKRLLAELADKQDLIEDVHNNAVRSGCDLEDGLAIWAGLLVFFPIEDTRLAVKLLAAFHLGDRGR